MPQIKSIFCLLLGLFFVSSFSQTPKLNLNFQKLTYEDGLTESQHNDFVFQDSKGFIWISSSDGLNRFDGKTVKNYRSESGLITKTIVSNFFEDEKTNIWFSTYEYLNCYIRQEDRIQTFSLNDTLGTKIAQDYQVFHYDTLKKRLWLSAGDQIFGLSTANPKDYFKLPYKTKSKYFAVAYDSKNSLNKIIVGRPDKGIDLLYLQDSILVERQIYLEELKSIKKPVILNDSLWIIFNNYKLGIFNENKPDDFQELESYSDLYFYDVLPYDDKNWLISTIGEGLQLYSWQTNKTVAKWKNNPTQNSSLSSNFPKKLHLTNNRQILWTSNSNHGVDYSFLHHNDFQNPLDTLLDKAEIVSIIEDQQQRIWVATEQNGIYVFSIEGAYLFSYQEPFMKEVLSTCQVLESNNGTFFCSTATDIYQLNSDNGNTSTKKIETDTSFQLLWFMANIFPNRIFVSSDSGVKEIYQKFDGNYYTKDCPELIEYQEFVFVQFHQTSQKKLYIPYNASELWIYESLCDSLKSIKKLDCNLQFFGFHESKKFPNTIWAGTNQGLVKIINDTTIVKITNENSDFKNETIFSVIEDEKGYLWMTSNKGLWKYDPIDSSKQVYWFNELDGLSSTFFSHYHSCLQTSNGDIWLGNNKGLVKFNPNEIEINTPAPKVYIDELLINDTEVYKGIGEKNTLELPYDKNTLTFDVLAIELIKPEQNKIFYRLIGYDDDWLSVDNNQRIRYTKIPHGQYNFEVKAVDVYGNESEIKNLSIKIKPPWWETWWFWLLATLAILFILYIIYNFRVQKLIEEEERKTMAEKIKNQELEAEIKEEEKKTIVEKLKNQALEAEMKAFRAETRAFRAQMNPHFLFNSLNSIKGLIAKKDEKKAALYLTKFASLLRSILENSNKPKVVLEKEIKALQLYIELESFRFTREFNYEIQINENIDTSFTRIPPLIMQPFVENAIWHGLIHKKSGVNKLNINIFREDDFIISEIEDNGVGRKKEPTIKDKKRKSFGIPITKKRVKLLHPDNEIHIIDLVDNTGNPLGTKVSIKLYAPE